MQLPLISAISKVRLSVPPDLRPLEARQSMLLSVQELRSKFPEGLPKLNPVKVIYGLNESSTTSTIFQNKKAQEIHRLVRCSCA